MKTTLIAIAAIVAGWAGGSAFMLTALLMFTSPSQLARTPIESVFVPLLPLVSPGLHLAISGFVAVAMFLAVWLIKRPDRKR